MHSRRKLIGIRNVHRSLLGARSTSEKATNASEAVDNDRTRITILRKGTGLGAIREDAPFFGGLLGFVAIEVMFVVLLSRNLNANEG